MADSGQPRVGKQAMETPERNSVVGEEESDLPESIGIVMEAKTSGVKAGISGRDGKHEILEATEASAEIEEVRGLEEAGPAEANKRESRERRGRDTGEAFKKKIIGKRGNSSGEGAVIGDVEGKTNVGMGMRKGVGGIVFRVGKAGFHEP